MKMPAEMKKDWIAALRSGEYKQGHGSLEQFGEHCCLGVLECVVNGDVERYKDGKFVGASYSLPTRDWYIRHRILETGYTEHELVSMNDVEKKSFVEIADWIEIAVEELS